MNNATTVAVIIGTTIAVGCLCMLAVNVMERLSASPEPAYDSVAIEEIRLRRQAEREGRKESRVKVRCWRCWRCWRWKAIAGGRIAAHTHTTAAGPYGLVSAVFFSMVCHKWSMARKAYCLTGSGAAPPTVCLHVPLPSPPPATHHGPSLTPLVPLSLLSHVPPPSLLFKRTR